ncbi:MAG: SDR family oxidoreductase [Chitinophagaceae bacterium]|nr:MAG: SDR family oxidoreductase [Chitinophagaceae bacterium]
MKSVLILGATSDVAMAVANTFAKEKYNIVLAARDAQRLQPLKSDLAIRFNVNCEVKEFDALDFDNHASFVASLQPLPLVTVCAFGFLGDEDAARTTTGETIKMIHSNYTGAVSILNGVAQAYKTKGEGTIIGISSVAGSRGRSSNYMYGSAKAGFTAYLSGLRNELFHHKVHVLTVLPGFIASKMTAHLQLPAMLTATPAQVANAIYKGFAKQKNVIYVKWFWAWIMLIIRLIPEPIFKRLKM